VWDKGASKGENDMTNAPMPGKRTNKEYVMQGWNARQFGIALADCPYYASSTAAKCWVKGWNS
jgi:hypothetical protein